MARGDSGPQPTGHWDRDGVILWCQGSLPGGGTPNLAQSPLPSETMDRSRRRLGLRYGTQRGRLRTGFAMKGESSADKRIYSYS